MLPLVWCLICVVLIMGLAYLFTKYVIGRAIPMGGARKGMMKILAQMPLGREKQVVLVQVGERFLLLGSAANGITMLAELSKDEIEAWREKERQPGDAEQPPSFARSLQEIVKQRGGRYHGD